MHQQQTGENLELAGNMIERHDLNPPSLLEITGIQRHGMSTTSGLNDYDYQNLSSLSMGLKHLNQLTTVNKIPIPPEIMEHFKHIKCHCMMGLFAEIGRAWLTIDSDIYIWTYEDERDVAYFDGLNHLIVSVGLVTPKPGVFVNDVKYLLVLTTPVEIVVLGVTFGDSTKTICSPNKSLQNSTPYEEMQLMTKPIFVVNTDNVAISTIESSLDGRIFMGGRDGSLYELQYQAQLNWFGRRCKKVNHSQSLLSHVVPGFLKMFSESDSVSKIQIDNSRGLLYVLFEKGGIEAWELEKNGGIRNLARISGKEIAQSAVNILKTVDNTVFKNVTAICALSQEDNPNMHLIAITQNGVRFYFSTIPLQQTDSLTGITTQVSPQPNLEQTQAPNRPQGLYLMHVRLPPGYTPNTTVGKPRQVHSAFHHQGTVLMVSTPQQEQDLLWSLSSDPFPMRPYLAESSTIMQMDGQVWDIAKVKDKQAKNLTISTIRKANQPTKIALLTNHGVHIVNLLKPVDLLQQLLLACHGPQHDAVKAYFQVQSEPEACATSLLLACLEQNRGSEMANWATQAFLLYGGEPSLSGGMVQARNLSSIHNQTNFEMNNNPMLFQSTPFPGSRAASAVQQSLFQQTQFSPGFNTSQLDQPQNIIFSAKHAGLYFHVSRILKPFWHRRCLTSNNNQLFSSITLQDCGQILEDLYAIKNFLEANSVANMIGYSSSGSYNQLPGSQTQHSVFSGHTSPGPGFHNQMIGNKAKNSLEEARVEEKRSLDVLNRFIKHTCEVMALWKMLCEHQFHVLVSAIPKEHQNTLQTCSFRDLILCRADICFQLIVDLINFYLNDNASVGSISSKLRDVCPSLYSHEDAVSHKATEILLLSKTVTDPEEKMERLHTALQLCKSAAPNLPLSNICQQFTAMGFHQGVVDLCETCASRLDPNGAGLHFYQSNEPQEDREGFLTYNSRLECYKEIKLMLDHVYQAFKTSNNGDILNGQQQKTEKANNDISNIVSLTLQSKDYLMHIAVYEWLLAHQMLGELLGIAEPSLGQFLNNSVAKCPDNQQLADLLWKYHERNGQHSSAAKILDTLASLETDRIPLTQRIEYLARAVMCMRSDSVGFSAHNGILLKDLEDKLEIAQVQKFILNSLNTVPLDGATLAETTRLLNSTLFTNTQLYMDFAERFDLWECKLKIVNSSHHDDALLIEMVWTKIMENEIEKAAGGSPYEKMTRLLSKVQNLVREYRHPGHCFRVPFLVRELEIHCCQLRLDSSPVPEALVKMELDIDTILDIYSRLISMNERIWFTKGNEWHLVQATINLVSIIARQPTLIPPKNKRRIIAKAQELVSACLNLLYTKPDTQHLIESLREIQTKLQRIAN